MTTTTLPRSPTPDRVLDRTNVQAIGGAVIRYGLVGIIGWIGLMKFTRVEAEAIWPFVQNSPLMSWASTALGVRLFSNVVGVVEVTIAVLIALRPIAARASALGSALAVGMFATTLSFLLTTPTTLENSRTPRAVEAQLISGLCCTSGQMASASTRVNFISPIQPMTPTRPYRTTAPPTD